MKLSAVVHPNFPFTKYCWKSYSVSLLRVSTTFVLTDFSFWIHAEILSNSAQIWPFEIKVSPRGATLNEYDRKPNTETLCFAKNAFTDKWNGIFSCWKIQERWFLYKSDLPFLLISEVQQDHPQSSNVKWQLVQLTILSFLTRRACIVFGCFSPFVSF